MSAIIVEPRNHAALEKVIENIHTGLQLPITLFHGIQNRDLAQSIKTKYPLRLREMPVSNLDVYQYSNLLMQPQFWAEAKHLSKDGNVLLFQTDAGVCDPSKTHENIAQLKTNEVFDLVGSPGVYNGMPFVNGGFSLRNPSTMERLLQQNNVRHTPVEQGEDWLQKWKPARQVANEDHWFSKACGNDPQCRMAYGDQAGLFACCTRQSTCDQMKNVAQSDSLLLGFHAFERGGAADACQPSRNSMCSFANRIRPLQRELTTDELELALTPRHTK